MKRILCLIIALMLVFSMTACGNKDESNNSENDNNNSAGNGHRETLTVAIGREPKALIPYASNDTGTSYITSQIYDSLIEADAEMKLTPSIATKWEQIDDTHYRFYLRDDVTFHNGSKLTAEDVLYTFEQASLTDASSSTIGPIDIANCVIEDEYTIVLALKEVYPAFLKVCSLNLTGIVCKEAMESDPEGYKTNPIGTGPFKFVAWATGDYLKFETNKEWWGGDINFDNLLLRYIPEASTRAIEAESGGVDIAHIGITDVKSTDANEKVSLYKTEILNTSYLSFNCNVEPFNNIKVRQAISLAIDAKAIVDVSYLGYADVAQSFIAPGVWGYYDTTSDYEGYDVEKAKQLLAEAGYPDGFDCTLVSNASQTTAEMIQAYLSEIGINVTLNITDFSNWLDAIVNGKQQMYIGGWTVPSADATEAFAAFDSANFGSGGNRSFYSNSDVDALIKKINFDSSEDTRYQACKDLQDLLGEECATVALNVGMAFYSVNKDISGFLVYPTQSPNFTKITFAK